MAKNFVSNKDETVRMFKSNFMEMFSKVHFSVPLYIYIPVISYLLYRSIAVYSLPFFYIIGLLTGGIFIWTFAEYMLHRFIFHIPIKTDLGKRIKFIFHGVHHDYPSDSKRLVMPPSISIPLAAFFLLLFWLIFGEVYMLPFFGGFLIGYLFYDMTHYAVHHFNMRHKFWLMIKNHHIRHHFKEDDKGYGVSSPFWDIIFKTGYKKESR